MHPPVDLIRQGIQMRRDLGFEYRGYGRVVIPMTLGISCRNRWQLRAQQVGGRSSSQKIGEDYPKLFDVELMTDVTLLATVFAVPRLFLRGDKAFMQIDTEL